MQIEGIPSAHLAIRPNRSELLSGKTSKHNPMPLDPTLTGTNVPPRKVMHLRNLVNFIFPDNVTVGSVKKNWYASAQLGIKSDLEPLPNGTIGSVPGLPGLSPLPSPGINLNRRKIVQNESDVTKATAFYLTLANNVVPVPRSDLKRDNPVVSVALKNVG